MKITKASIDELNAILMDMIDDTGQQIRDAADTWLDDENEADERRDARETLEEQIPALQEQVESLVNLLS